MTTEAEIGIMWLKAKNAKDCLQPSGDRRENVKQISL